MNKLGEVMSGNSEITKWLIQLRDIIISGTGKPAEIGNAIRDIIEEEGSISEKDLYWGNLKYFTIYRIFCKYIWKSSSKGNNRAFCFGSRS